MKYLTRTISICLALIGSTWSSAGCQISADSLEALVAAHDSLIAAFQEQREELTLRLDQTAQLVVELKGRTELGFLQRRRLEGLAQEFQTMSDRADILDRQIRDLEIENDSLLQALWQHYQIETNRLVAALTANIETMTEKERQRDIGEIAKLRRRKRSLSARLQELPPSRARQWHLTIKPDDDYQRIKDKADLLKDSEDRIRKNIAQIDRKIEQFRQEIDLRERLGDFVDDVSLFEQRDEALISAHQSAKDAVENALIFSGYDATRGSPTGQETGSIFTIGESLWGIDPWDLPSEGAETVILLLGEYRSLFLAQADSLASRAQLYYQEAKQARMLPPERKP